jgi:hypothetical protein
MVVQLAKQLSALQAPTSRPSPFQLNPTLNRISFLFHIHINSLSIYNLSYVSHTVYSLQGFRLKFSMHFLYIQCVIHDQFTSVFLIWISYWYIIWWKARNSNVDFMKICYNTLWTLEVNYLSILWCVCPMKELLSHRNLETRTQQENYECLELVARRRTARQWNHTIGATWDVFCAVGANQQYKWVFCAWSVRRLYNATLVRVQSFPNEEISKRAAEARE